METRSTNPRRKRVNMDPQKVNPQTSHPPPELSPVTQLLHRVPPLDYIEEWEITLSREKGQPKILTDRSLVIFRLGSEYLALSSTVVGQITTLRKLHRIPHIKNPIICGVVNVNGRLRLFFSLERLLEMNQKNEIAPETSGIEPMILIDYEDEVWTFGITEVLGVFQCDLSQMKNVPVTVSKSAANYIKGVLKWRDIELGVLDEELLLFRLRRSL